jgi:hypothetical protein
VNSLKHAILTGERSNHEVFTSVRLVAGAVCLSTEQIWNDYRSTVTNSRLREVGPRQSSVLQTRLAGGGRTGSPTGVTYAEDIPPSTIKSVPWRSEYDVVSMREIYLVEITPLSHSYYHHWRLPNPPVRRCSDERERAVDARNNAARANSTASPNLPIGRWTIRRSRFSGVLRKSMSRAAHTFKW